MTHIRLALDLSTTRTGWAIEEMESGRIRTGVVCLRRGGRQGSRSPLYAVRLKRRLEAIRRCYVVEQLVLEEAFGRGNAKWLLDSLQIMAMAWATEHDITWQRVNPGEWKLACTGNGNARRDEYHRAAVVRWPGMRIPYDDNAAALFLLEYGRQTSTL